MGPALTATDVYNAIRYVDCPVVDGGSRTRLISSAYRCFLITHAHLDHINGLVVSAGSLTGPRKRIYAVEQTLKDIASVFNDRIWPNLASWNEDDDEYKLLYSTYAFRTDSTTAER